MSDHSGSADGDADTIVGPGVVGGDLDGSFVCGSSVGGVCPGGADGERAGLGIVPEQEDPIIEATAKHAKAAERRQRNINRSSLADSRSRGKSEESR